MPKPKLADIILLIPGYNPHDQAGDCTFDEKAAWRAIDFGAECIKHVKGDFAGKPFIEPPWEMAITANLFGWKRPDGHRRYREALIYVPRGNGKTPWSAKTAATMLFCDGEPGAEIYIAASEAKQADKCFEHLMGMVRQEPELSSRCKVFKGMGHRSIQLTADPASVCRVVASDGGAAHGWQPHLVVADEIHVWKKRDFAEAIETAFSKKGRKQPLLVWVTTADFDRESVCNDKYDYACSVRDNGGDKLKPGYNPEFLPVIYEAPKGADWTDEKTWEIANPNIDITVDRPSLRRDCQKAREQPAKENEFKRLHLNIRTQTESVGIPMPQWDVCTTATDPVAWRRQKLVSLRKEPCNCGLDLGRVNDLTTAVLLFQRDERQCDVLPYFWMPEDTIEQAERKDNAPYRAWARQGFLTLTPGDSVHYDGIRADMNKFANEYSIKEIQADRLFQGDQLCKQLIGDGLPLVAVAQSFYGMAAPTKRTLELIADGLLDHGANPVLRWMASHATVETDTSGNMKFVKTGGKKKIDGIIGLVMAVSRLTILDNARSVYETRGLVTL